MKIVLGQSAGKPVKIDVSELTNSNLLIEGATGSGKSYAARKILEELLRLKMQCIIIDPDGELVTLREKFDVVFAGVNGEAPMSLHTATMLAEKILEHQFSCICDLSEIRKSERPKWVKSFLEALMESPKKYWHQVKIVFIDEVHLFCPEDDRCESTAAVNDLAGRGLKRGLVTVAATQRISKFNKDAAVELQNILVGRHFMDIDRQRAAETLGVAKADRNDFMAKIKVLPRGDFFAIGAAISEECIQLHVDPVQTTHPERGSKRKAVAVPPAPHTLNRVLEAIRDLPNQVETKLKTEADYKARIRTLEADLRNAQSQRPVAAPAPPKTVTVVDSQAIERAVQKALRANNQHWEREWNTIFRLVNKLASVAKGIVPLLGEIPAGPPPYPSMPAEAPPVERREGGRPPIPGIRMDRASDPRNHYRTITTAGTAGLANHLRERVAESGLTGPEQRILNAIAWFESIGITQPEQTAVAFLAGYTTGGGAYNNPRGRLNQSGLIRYVPGDKLALTDEGRAKAQSPEAPLTAHELQEMVLNRLPGPERKILRVLIEAYPDGLSNEEVARRAGYAAGGGAYNNPRGRLRSFGLIDYQDGQVIARPLLFLK